MQKMGLLFLGAVVLAGATAMEVAHQPAHAAEECAELPDVEWWNTSHEKIKKFVEIKHKGNWRPYIENWEKQLDVLQNLNDSGRSAYIRSRKLTLEGDDLIDYIDKVAVRVEIIKCLRNNELEAKLGADKDAEPVSGFGKGRAFSAKTPNVTRRQSTAKPDQEVVVEDRELKLKIAARCDGTTAIFEIANQGEKWPRLATIGTYQVDLKKAVTKRRMRLAKDQVVTFRLTERDKDYRGAIGLFIEPTWFERPPGMDAQISCKSPATG